jgi:ubiquinone/menaquinone biosynthesis C-methylase UbiE
MPKRSRHIAEYYDAEYANLRMLEQDTPFMLGRMPNSPQRVLELCAGTARAAIPLAQAGHRVCAVDNETDMLELARQKRAGVGLSEKQLKLVNADVLKLKLREKFDWVFILFNTFLSFTTLEQQDQFLRVVTRHIKIGGRFWIDIFNPDLRLTAETKLSNLEPTAFFVPSLRRAVFRVTDIQRSGPQTDRVVFRYQWFDDLGQEMKESVTFNLTFLTPRELQLLLERNGLKIEQMWGDYDGSMLTSNSPRIIAQCCRK